MTTMEGNLKVLNTHCSHVVVKVALACSVASVGTHQGQAGALCFGGRFQQDGSLLVLNGLKTLISGCITWQTGVIYLHLVQIDGVCR